MVHIPIHILPIEDDGFHLCVEGLINDKPARFLIDTGASRTVFDSKRISAFAEFDFEKLEAMDKLSTGLGTNTMKSHLMFLESLQLGDFMIDNYKAVIIDLSHINTSYQQIGLEPIDGVIGGDILKLYKAIIDYDKQLLKLEL